MERFLWREGFSLLLAGKERSFPTVPALPRWTLPTHTRTERTMDPGTQEEGRRRAWRRRRAGPGQEKRTPGEEGETI